VPFVLLIATAQLTAAFTNFLVSDDSFTTGTDYVRLKVLSNRATGEHVSVVIDGGGGGIDSLFLAPPAGAKNSSLREVLWSHNRNATQVKTNPTWKGRMLLPYANRIGGAKYSFNGSEFHLPINDVAGLNNSLHGLLWDKSMAVAAVQADDSHASVTLEYTFNAAGEQRAPGYPFALKVAIEYRLSAHRFDVAVHAKNVDPAGWPLPFYNGWHPYFLCHPCADAFIKLDPAVGWEHVDVGMGKQFPPPRYSNMVPTTHTSPWAECNGSAPIGPSSEPSVPGPLYMDDEVKALTDPGEGFTTALVDPATSQSVLLHHDSAMRYLQIFTGAMASFPDDVDAVVLEPLSAMSDAYNNHDGLHIVSAGETYTSRFAVEVA